MYFAIQIIKRKINIQKIIEFLGNWVVLPESEQK